MIGKDVGVKNMTRSGKGRHLVGVDDIRPYIFCKYKNLLDI